MSKPLRAGVIGIGVGLLHARGYQAVPGVDLVALCDLSEERLAQRAAEFPPTVARYTDYHAMLAQADLDVVSICVPNVAHPQVTTDILAAGVHVIGEKPLATDLAGAEAIVAAAQQAPGKFTVCYDKRYRADTQWLHQAVQSGTLGEIYQVEAGWKRETGIPGGWFSQKDMAGGGPLIDLGVHVLDLALWVLDFPAVQTVSGTTRAVFGPEGRKTWGTKTGGRDGYGVEDGALGLLRVAGGGLNGSTPLLLEASWADHRRPGEDDIYLRFAGSEGAAAVHVRNYTHDDTLRVFTEINGTAVEAKPNLRPPQFNGHAGLINAFVTAIREETPVPAPAAEGLVTVQVLDAFYRSAAQGREIVLAE